MRLTSVDPITHSPTVPRIDASTQQQIALDGNELARGLDERFRGELGHAVDLDALAMHIADFLRQQVKPPLAEPSVRWMNGFSFTSKPIARSVFCSALVRQLMVLWAFVEPPVEDITEFAIEAATRLTYLPRERAPRRSYSRVPLQSSFALSFSSS